MPSSPTPTPTKPSPSPSATGIPAAAKVKSEAGAIAFARFYFDQVNRAWTAPDPGLIVPLGEPGCSTCAEFEKTARQLKSARNRYAADPVTCGSLLAVGGAPKDHQLLHASVAQHKVNVINQSGAVVTTDQAKDLELIVELIWKADEWRIWDIGSR